MASQEHVQLLAEDTSSSTTSSSPDSASSLEHDEESAPPPMPCAGHPKMRLKLSLRMPGMAASPRQSPPVQQPKTTSLPATGAAHDDGDAVMQEAVEEQLRPSSPPSSSSDAKTLEPKDTAVGHVGGDQPGDVVLPAAHATIVETNSDADGTRMEVDEPESEEVQEATVVSSTEISATIPEPQAAVSVPTTTAPKPSRRTSTANTQRPPKIPTMPSPGLMLPPPASGRLETDAQGLTTPQSIFDHCMAAAGYTTERRTENPHRGSSIKRVVGDMFDSDVKSTLHFPSLVPEDLWKRPRKDKEDSGAVGNDDRAEDENTSNREMGNLLIQALSAPRENGHVANTPYRKGLLQLSDMAPTSLILPYPESYMDQCVDHAALVTSREKAIIESQEAMLAAEESQARYEELKGRHSQGAPPTPALIPAPVHVPPIPDLPTPPAPSELPSVPTVQDKFVAHLDSSCYRITDARYFGLKSNYIADPQFVGPIAPGIHALSFSAAAGLATCFGNASSSSLASGISHHATGPAVRSSSLGVGGDSSHSAGGEPSGPTRKANGSSSTFQSRPNPGPALTSTSTSLRKMMEADDAQSQTMKRCILRAAVYASRTGKHRMSFVGVDGETYPDVSKAFAMYAGIRPCDRCKTNKQGSYHCRLRRKHKDLDYDGGNSPELLAPMFAEPLEDLILGK